MGLKINRSERRPPKTSTTPSVSTNANWSARDYAPLEDPPRPTLLEHVTADPQGHLSGEVVAHLFDQLWKAVQGQQGITVELDMADVKSRDDRFASELEFFRRQLQRQGGEVRLKND